MILLSIYGKIMGNSPFLLIKYERFSKKSMANAHEKTMHELQNFFHQKKITF